MDQSDLLELAWWKSIQNPGEWKSMLQERLPESVPTALTRHTQTGRPRKDKTK